MAQLLLQVGPMIVSALVVTSKGSLDELARRLQEDKRIEVGSAEKGFLPLVTTANSLRSSRELFEYVRKQADVTDLQLVSWTDEDALDEANESNDLVESKEMQ